ncbi:MAG: hypothetical protein H6581_23955 [Bacteroidia bacterium]|nr:hypothetical protein [Bacteroidia bacterium]
MKDLLKSLTKKLKKLLLIEVKGFAGEMQPPGNTAEYIHIGTEHQYDKVGGKDDESTAKPPKGVILMPFLLDKEGYDPGDTIADISVTLSITKAGVLQNLNFTIENLDYDALYAAAQAEDTIVKESLAAQGRYFTIANPGGEGFISYVHCDSNEELIQVTHPLMDSFNDTGCAVLINKSLIALPAQAKS